ncbi:hypothetical protein K492DRAFT_171833 [Lichtheimia hyalospora FSU 10163]|nr:hypothetical protein K492DRAFT_171833 [Lichtheimia hyalospora FSU 10163]
MVSSLLQTLPPIGQSFETTHTKASSPSAYTINEKENTALRLSKAVIDQKPYRQLHARRPISDPLLHTEQAHGSFVVLQSIQSFISLMLHTRFPSIVPNNHDGSSGSTQGPSSSSSLSSSVKSRSSSCMMSLGDHDGITLPKTPTRSIPIPKSHIDRHPCECQETNDVDTVQRFQFDTHSMYKREPRAPDVFELSWSNSSFFNQTPSNEQDNVIEASCQPQAQQEAPMWTKTHCYVRDVRSNVNEFRMLAAEINMVRASKITRPLRNRHWLGKRHDTFVWGRRTCLRIVNVGEHNKQCNST